MKSRAARIILLVLLLSGAFLMRFLGSDTAGELICRELEKRVSQGVPGASLTIGTCVLKPWEAAARFADVSFSLSGDVPVQVSAGAIELQLLGADLLFAKRLKLGSVTLSDIAVEMDLSRAGGGDGSGSQGQGGEDDSAAACPAQLLDMIRVERFILSGARLAVRLPGKNSAELTGISAFIHSGPKNHVLKISTGEGAFTSGVALFPISRLRLSASFDLKAEELTLVHTELAAGNVSFFARGKLGQVCGGPKLDLIAQAAAPLELLDTILPDAQLDAHGNVSVRARITGTAQTPTAEGDLVLKKARLSGFDIGDAYLAAQFERGTVGISRLELNVGRQKAIAKGSIALDGPGFPSKFHLELDRIGFGRLVDKLTLHGVWPDFSASGTVDVSGTLAPFHLAGRARLDVRDFKVFDRAWDAPKRTAMLELKPARLEMNLDFSPTGVHLADVDLTTQASQLNVDTWLYFDSDRGLDIETYIGRLDLSDLGHIVQIPWSGILSGKARIKGPYSKIAIDGKIGGQRMTFQSLDFGTVRMGVHFGDNVLSFQDIRIQRGRSLFRAGGELDFRGREPEGRGEASFDSIWLSDLVDMIGRTHWVFDFLKDRSEARLTGSARVDGPLVKPHSLVRADFEDFTYFGRNAGQAKLEFRTQDGEIVAIDRFDIEGPIGQLSASGEVRLSEGLDFRVSAPFLSVRELSLPQGESLDASGAMKLDARIAGGFDDVKMRGEAHFTDLSLLGFELGEGQLALGMDENVLWVQGPLGEALLLEASMEAGGRMPFAADVRVSTQKLRDYLPPSANIEGALRALVHAGGTLDDPDGIRGTIDVSQLRLSRGRLSVAAASPFTVAFTGQGALEAPELSLTGSNNLRADASLKLGADKSLDCFLDGLFDAGLVEFFTNSIEQAGGPMHAELTLRGTLGAPIILGTLTFKDVHGELSDLPIAAQELGGTITFSQNRLYIDSIRGTVNDGPLQLRGMLGFDGFFSPGQLDLSLSLDSAQMTIPAWLPSTLSGDIRLSGTLDKLALTGSALVTGVRYQRDVGIDPKSLLESLGSRAPSFLHTEESQEWLSFDVNVRLGDDVWLDNNLVRARLGGDLQVVGSNLNLGVIGTVRSEELGKAFFRGNEFELTRASVDFTDKSRIAAILDVHGETELRDYRVFLRVMGTLDDPEVTLSSDPALDQADLVMLLTLGFTTQETDMASSSSVGIGLIGETLLNLSGIDKQVKRFIPQNALFRDFNIQLSTQYSEVSGTVEPMAQLESKLFTDDLRLRFSQPVLSNKGRQAHLEYRVNEHLSTQMQWNDESSELSVGDIGLDLKLRWEFR